MLYVSQILNRPIFDARNEKIAAINDVLVRYGDEDHPHGNYLQTDYTSRWLATTLRMISSSPTAGS